MGSFSITRANAQTTNQGTDFYLGFMQNLGTSNLRIFVTGSVATVGTVAVPGLAFSTPFAVTPGTITTVVVPSTAASQTSNVVDNLGVHVTALAPVTVYGLNEIPYTTDAYLGLPLPLLGTSYIALGFTGGLGGPSEFQVVGTQDGTQVTITPAAAATGHAAGVPYTITLNQLQTYQLQATSDTTDLSGSLITSTAPVSVFAGALCTNIPNTGYVACDHVMEQIPATVSWGKNFLTVPLDTRVGGDTFRVLASAAGTTVAIDGTVVATLGSAQFYQSVLSHANHTIATSNASLVAQYSNSTSYDNVTSDPFEMLISPTEQFQTSYTVTTPSSNPTAYTNYINVAASASDVSSCRVDGSPITTFTAIGTSGYVGAEIPVAIGTHNLSCPDPFGVYVYGFASYDSYGYPGGLGGKGINSSMKCDVNGDGRIDSKDINIIFAARNTPATGIEDPRDADGDLVITVADARVCQQRCTSAACAVQ
jgi:hypothetical protein